jgi:hypothetical protein
LLNPTENWQNNNNTLASNEKFKKISWDQTHGQAVGLRAGFLFSFKKFGA